MKRILCITGCLSISLLIVHSQAPSRFPLTNNNTWRVDIIVNGISDENIHNDGDEIFKYYTDGDTIIKSVKYLKVYKSGTSYFGEPLNFRNIYVGAIRDSGNKFFFIEKNQMNEVLLYDFNLEVGDTTRGMIFPDKIVSSVDTLMDGRKIIHYNPPVPIIGCGDRYMIEGMGSSGGLLEEPACWHSRSLDNHLVCFVQDNLLIYHDNNNNFNCEVISPNPSSSIDSTGIWQINKEIDSDTISDFEKLQYYFNSDTIINSFRYYKLYKTGFQLFRENDENYIASFNNSVYVGALRNINKKYFFIDQGKNKEILLYDFSLKAGEIVKGLIGNGDTIMAIDTILDNRKVFYLSDSRWEKMIIEGIGSASGLLEQVNDNSYLICYSENKAPLYHDQSGAECQLNYKNLSFQNCDKAFIMPLKPSINDEIKIITRMCYQIPYENGIRPVLVSKDITRNDNSYDLNLYYEEYNTNNSDLLYVPFPALDTISLGVLSRGDYYLYCNVHTIHKGGEGDTSFYDKSAFIAFSVSSDMTVPSNITNSPEIITYPNPVINNLTIEMPGSPNSISTLEIYDILGARIYSGKLEFNGNSDKYRLNLTNYKPGIYFIKVYLNDYCITQKLIVE